MPLRNFSIPVNSSTHELWANGNHPNTNENLPIRQWEENILTLLKDYVNKNTTLSNEEKVLARKEAGIIAKNYVAV